VTIAAAAKEAGVGVETIRYYERRGLIRRPTAGAGYRHYPPNTIREVRFIREAQRLGFTLEEIRELIAIANDDAATCGDVCSTTDRKLAEVRERIAQLTRLAGELESMICSKDCAAPPRACKLLETLDR